MFDYLNRILEYHKRRIADDRRSFEYLLDEARSAHLLSRDFAKSLSLNRERGNVGVIAEFKRRSPSKGEFISHLSPALIAADYQAGGATCLSVLTDQNFFSGDKLDFIEARNSCSLPVLRKDFILSPSDICDSRIIGADAVLLIASVLDIAELTDFISLTEELGMDALVETHSEDEILHACEAGASLIGINQRDLNTFEEDHKLAEKLYQYLPPNSISVAESAIRRPEDARKLFDIGFDGVLVGESFITASDPGAAVKNFIRYAT